MITQWYEFYSTYIVTSFYKSALESLIAENPKDQYWLKLKKQFNERD